MFTVPVIIGNLCTLLAVTANSVSATRKTKKEMLGFQNISQLSYCASAIALRGYSAAVQNVVSICRNIVAVQNVKNKILEWILIILGVALGIVFNNRGIVGLLPVIGTLQYTLTIFYVQKNERLLKLSFLISTAIFVVFNAFIYNFVGVAADATVFVTTVIALVKDKPQK